jgi:hypothetical protein
MDSLKKYAITLLANHAGKIFWMLVGVALGVFVI